MKKLTLLIMAVSVSLLSFAAGGNITYELNGGVTNPKGWQDKNDMYMGLNEAWNTFSGTSTTWKSLDQLLAENNNDPVEAVPKGIPTQAGGMDLPFIQDAAVAAEWQWLVDYMDATCDAQGKTLPSTSGAFLRYNFSAFFLSSVRPGWPASADYGVAGLPAAFMPAWKHGFAGPASYDGTEDITLPDPYKEGETFGGWYLNADFSGDKVTKIEAGTEGDITLYAKWDVYVPTCAEVRAMEPGESTMAAGVVTHVGGNVIHIQDASTGLKVAFAAAPDVNVGDAVVLSGTTAAEGSFVKLVDAAIDSKESGELPSLQTVTLAILTDDAAPYMFEFVSISGVNIKSKDASAMVIEDNDGNSVDLVADTSFDVGVKINLKAVVSYDGGLQLVASTPDITAAPVPNPDPATYAAMGDGKYTLTNKWLVSNNMDNFIANRIGIADHVRGMAAKDGKMYFIDRNLEQLTVIDGENGDRLAPVPLASNIFTYTDGEGETRTAGALPFNDIKIDNAGNVLLGNCITSVEGVFQIWKVDVETGEGELILQDILKENEYYEEETVRFDAFGVYGDVDGDAIIMAANASAMQAYKWEISGGTAGEAEAIDIDIVEEGTYLTGLENPGSAPQIFPIDEDYFYLDGNATLPTLIDMEGNILDGFFNSPVEVEDWNTGLDRKQGHNGVVEFEVGGEYFLLMAYTNTLGDPPSAFRLFKFKDANKEFKDIEGLWVFPAAGMGTASNAYRTAVPTVVVDGDVATFYLYTGENGYGVYEFTVGDETSVKNNYGETAIKLSLIGRTLDFNEVIADVSVYSVTGQLVAQDKNVSTLQLTSGGVYLVKATKQNGETGVVKLIVK